MNHPGVPLARQLALLSRQSGRRAGPAGAAPSAPVAPGTGDTAAPCPPAPSLADRLQRLEVRARAATPAGDHALARRLDGRVHSDGLIEIESRHPLDRPHGSRALDGLRAPDLRWLTGGNGSDPPADLLFIDTETTGLAGGSGTLAFLIGAARVRDATLVITQWLLTRFSAEAAMLRALTEYAAPAQSARAAEWVSYNGKSFDLPLLLTRLRLARLPDTIAGLAHHDLLHPVRTAFGRDWPDCRLQTVESRLLDVHRHDDLPGHRIPAVWADFVQFGEARELPALVEHNRLDLLSLAALLPELSRIYLFPAAVPGSDCSPRGVPDAAAIARMQLRRRRAASARAHLCAHEPQLDARARLDLAALHRARRDWPAALRIWQALAAEGSPAAIEALAKYHEHVSRDLAQALHWSAVLCRTEPARAAHQRRRQRLLDRQRRSAASAARAAGARQVAADLFGPPAG